jgi:hypothetical protein
MIRRHRNSGWAPGNVADWRKVAICGPKIGGGPSLAIFYHYILVCSMASRSAKLDEKGK